MSILEGTIEIQVEKIRVNGKGVIILTGPSSCGKGEVANTLRKALSIPKERHLSMGDILRMTISKARASKNFQETLSKTYHISNDISIFDHDFNKIDLINKALNHKDDITMFFDESSFISQVDWLEYCVTMGLLIPDSWTVSIINAIFDDMAELKDNIFILDGYPRTKVAAEELLNTFEELDISVIDVIHLAITKNEMKKRAYGRKRIDDTEESLERRYQFYIENVQPSIDYMKERLGPSRIKMIDAHQPVWIGGELDLEASINNVTTSVLRAMGLPNYMISL